MFGKQCKQPQISDDEYAAQTLKMCQMSMARMFLEQETILAVSDNDTFMAGFLASPEYQQAFESYMKRMGKQRENRDVR